MTRAFRMQSIRSTPLRVTILLLSIFTVAAIGSFSAAYLVIRTNLNATLQADMQQSVATYRAISDPEELRERLAEVAATTDPATRIVQYLPDGGGRISNVAGFPAVSSGAVVSADDITHPEDMMAESYLALSARVGPGQLILAQTRTQIVDMAEVFVSVLLMGLLPAIAIAAFAGLSVARRARRRIDDIQNVLSALTGGTYAARVAGIADRDDDLSGIGHAVNQMANAQQILMDSMRQISTDIAHDLKTPIQRVAVVLDQMLTRTVLSDGQEDLLTRAVSETDRIVQTFQALLQLAQIEGGAVRDRLVPTDLCDVAKAMVDFLSLDAEDHGFDLTLTADGPGPWVVKGDRHLLSQLIANLIQNALVHVPKGGPIRVLLRRQGPDVILTVSDRGPGIPAAERDKVLRRLYRREQSRTTEGNGLGLSLVAAICDLHRAQLRLSDNDPGLVVEVTIQSV